MGQGEETMKRWGYLGGSFSIVVGVCAVIFAIMTIVALKSVVSAAYKENVFTIGVVVLIIAVVAAVIGIVAVLKVRRAHQVYVQVGLAAAAHKIPVVAPSPTESVAAPMPTATSSTTTSTAPSPSPSNATFNDII